MHRFSLPQSAMALSVAYRGRAHPCERLEGARTALVVIDLQNYFMAPGEQAEVPMAREIVPTVNRLASIVRAAGGRVVWVQTSSASESRRTWSTLHDRLMTPERRERRWSSMEPGAYGFQLWHSLEVDPNDSRIIKTRYSAFIQGSSNAEAHLREVGIDTVLIAGTATDVCCESSARDAMMLNFRVAMVSDTLAAMTDEIHAASLLCFYRNFGDVLTTDEVAAAFAVSESRLEAAQG